MPEQREVVIETSGRGGSIRYTEGPLKIGFGWEFGGTCVALIFGDSLRQLRESGSVTAGRAREILDFVAQQAVAQKAVDCTFEIDEERCDVTIL